MLNLVLIIKDWSRRAKLGMEVISRVGAARAGEARREKEKKEARNSKIFKSGQFFMILY